MNSPNLQSARTTQLKPVTYDNLRNYLTRYNSSLDKLPEPFTQLTSLRDHLPIGELASNYQIQEAINEVISQALELLDDRNPEFGLVILRRFVSEKPITLREMAKNNRPDAWKKEETRLNQVQKKAITELAEIINGEEHKARAKAKTEMVHNLGAPSYQHLIGTKPLEQELVNNLLNNDRYNIFMLTGYGGVGKSSLADRMIRLALEKHLFYHVIRIDVINGVINPDFLSKQLAFKLFNRPLNPTDSVDQIEKKVAQALTTLPWLILIDGIEDKLEPVLEKIKQFCSPTKFIVTSREKPADQSQVYCKEVPPLLETDGFTLFTQTLNAVQDRPEGDDFQLNQFTPIFDKVGGNPLAIKLVVTLTQQMSLPDILEDLKLVDHAQIRALYDRVYKRIWGMLDQKSRQILISLALFNKKHVTHEMILGMNQFGHVGMGLVPIDSSDLYSCLNQLSNQSLIETSGSVLEQSYRYGLHNLTHSYLRTSIIQWPIGFEIAEQYGQITPLPQIQQGLQDWLARANDLDKGGQPESEILQDLNNITEVIEVALYWPETRRDAVELLQKVWSLLQRHGYFDTLEAQLEKAIQFLVNRDNDLATVLRLKNRLGQIWRKQSHIEKALEVHQQNLQEANESQDLILQAEVEFQLAEDYFLLQKNQLGLEHAQRAIDLFEQFPEAASWLAAAENTIGQIYFRQGDFELAIGHFERAANYADSVEDVLEQSRYLRNSGLAWMRLNSLDTAEQYLDKALSYVENNLLEKSEILNDLGLLHMQRGDVQLALNRFLEANSPRFLEIPVNWKTKAFIRHNIGWANLCLEQFLEAEKNLKLAIHLSEFAHDLVQGARSKGLLGETYLKWGKYQQAVPIYDQSISVLQSIDSESNLVKVLVLERKEAIQNLEKSM